MLTPGSPIELNPLPYVCTMSTTGINDNIPTDEFISIINPFDQSISIRSKKEMKNLTVLLYSITGNLLYEWKHVSINKNELVSLLIAGHLADGAYFLSYSNDEQTGYKKLVKLNN